jgi:DNA polymerase
MDIVTIDFETYYDKEFSLSKMTTEAYVRDPRFEVIGVGIKVNDHQTDFYSGENPGRFLRSLDYKDKAILCHNTPFDGLILSHHFNIRPRFWLDTLSMARPRHAITVGGSLKALVEYYRLGAKGDEVLNALGKRRADFDAYEMARYGDYCRNDVDLTYKLFLELRKGFPASELRLIDQTLRLYTEPTLVINRLLLERHLENVLQKKSNLVEALGLDCTEEEAKKILMSNEKFAEYLAIRGVQPPTKISQRTGKQTYAFSKTDRGFTDLLEHPDESVQNAAAARLGVKSTLEETRTRSLIGVAERGPLPILLNYYGAHTGRFSGGDKMNLQNLPRGGALRKSLCAPEGKMLVACDSAQIEARVVAWVAEQNDLLDAFREGRDVYSEFASEVYGKKVTKADKIERFVGKTCILGLGYGMGAEKFKATLAIGAGGMRVNLDTHEAKRIVQLYRTKNHKIASFWNRCNVALDIIYGKQDFNLVPHSPHIQLTDDGIQMPNGLAIKYPMLTMMDNAQGFAYAADGRVYREALKDRVLGKPINTEKFIRVYGGKVTENLVQGLARIVVAEQMVKIGERYKVVLQVHDEVVILCDADEVEEAKAYMLKVMSTPPKWAEDLPVACEADYGLNYGECK